MTDLWQPGNVCKFSCLTYKHQKEACQCFTLQNFLIIQSVKVKKPIIEQIKISGGRFLKQVLCTTSYLQKNQNLKAQSMFAWKSSSADITTDFCNPPYSLAKALRSRLALRNNVCYSQYSANKFFYSYQFIFLPFWASYFRKFNCLNLHLIQTNELVVRKLYK